MSSVLHDPNYASLSCDAASTEQCVDSNQEEPCYRLTNGSGCDCNSHPKSRPSDRRISEIVVPGSACTLGRENHVKSCSGSHSLSNPNYMASSDSSRRR